MAPSGLISWCREGKRKREEERREEEHTPSVCEPYYPLMLNTVTSAASPWRCYNFTTHCIFNGPDFDLCATLLFACLSESTPT